jgi:endonuclease YncB( thermonuclease family)
MKRLIASLILILLPLPALAADYPARVVGVADGDTLTVLTAEKKQVKIRLHGIDAPESGRDYGSRAKQVASELAFGKQVTIRPVDTDRYGRTVADVILPDGRSMNREMVGQGLAWWYRYYAREDNVLERLESEARSSGRGLWAQSNPVPPWDWRNGTGVPVTAGVVGNKRSHLYHTPHCRGVASMSAQYRVVFKTAAEAEAVGYRKAGDCR